MLEVLSYHQGNLLFLLIARDIENHIEYFLLKSNILRLIRNRYTLRQTTAQVTYVIFLISLKVLTNCQIQGSFMFFYSGLPM